VRVPVDLTAPRTSAAGLLFLEEVGTRARGTVHVHPDEGKVWRDSAATRPGQVTIGFPPRSSGEITVSLHAADGGVIEGQGNALWAEAAQRGAASPHVSPPPPVRSTPAGTTQVSRPPVIHLPRATVSTSHILPPFRIATSKGARAPLSFLRPRFGLPPRAAGPPVSSPSQPIFFQPILGGFGFFGPFWAFRFGPGCNPFWAWPWVCGCNGFAYWDGYGWLGPAFDSNLYETESEEPTEQQPEPENYIWVPPPENSAVEIQAEKLLTVLYLKDGAVYAVTNYWIENNQLHYLTSYGGENTIRMDDIDLQKTVDVNAKRGVEFILKPAPSQKPEEQPPENEPNPNEAE
jgi:hypothetical protein